MTAAEPASHGAFANKYSIFVDITHIDNANVQFPDIANRNRAGDSPSHFVSTFFTVKGVQEKRVRQRSDYSRICGMRAPTAVALVRVE